MDRNGKNLSVVIPAQAGIQAFPARFRVSLLSPGMTGCRTSWLGNEDFVSEQGFYAESLL